MSSNSLTPSGPGRSELALKSHAVGFAADSQGLYSHSQAAATQEAFLNGVHEAVRVLRRFKWVILSIVMASTLIGFAATLMSTRLYTAAVRLEIDSAAARVVQKGEVAPTEMRDFEFLRTQFELMQSRSVAERAVASLKLADDPEFTARPAPTLWSRLLSFGNARPEPTPADRTAIEKGIAGLVLANRTVRPVPGSRLVDLSYTDKNPERARLVVMALASQFIVSLRDKKFEATEYAKTFLEDQLQQLKSKLEQSDNVLIAFGEKEKIVATAPDRASIAENNLAAANAALGNLIADRIKNEQLYHQVENANDATLPQFLSNAAIASLRDRRNTLVTEYQEKQELFRSDYPAMQQVNNKIKETDKQIANEIRVIKTSLKGAYDAALAQEQEMKARVETLRAEVLDLQKRSIQYNILKHESESNRSLYDDLLQRYKEIDVAGGVGASNVFIVDPAETPKSPSWPSYSKNLGVAGALGLALGLLAAFILERLDNRVSKIEELERVSGLPTLGVVPLVEHGIGLDAEIQNHSSRLWEAYRSLATALQFASTAGLPRSLFFTSSQAAEGKSLTSFAVARHFSSLGLKVLLIDADMRRPSLHKKLGVNPGAGLSNYITGAPLEKVVFDAGTPNLWFIPAGPISPNASEMLASPRIAVLMQTVVETYDLVVVDGPPIMGLADANLLSRATEATVFVARAGKVEKHQIRAALKRLRGAHCHLLGAVFTQYKPDGGLYDDYAYSYKQGYTYGKAYDYGADQDETERERAAAREPNLIGSVKALLFK